MAAPHAAEIATLVLTLRIILEIYMKSQSLASMHRLVWTAIMAAAICVGAYLVVPIGPVPVSMQPFFVFLAGYVLGSGRGGSAVGLYLMAGAVGLPVFSGGGAGVGHLFGPTGGYLFGFGIAAFLCGMADQDNHGIRWKSGLFWGLLGLLMVYIVGAAWLKFSLDMSWTKAYVAGVAPFILWDVAKLCVALAAARYLRRCGLLP